MSTKRNQMYEACNECATILNQSFNDKPKAGALDKILCEKLTRWAESVFKG